MVNFLSLFCPELQKLLKPIHDLTRKDRQFTWGKEQQIAFKEIKHRLEKTPVLTLPNSTGRLHLYSDTSKFATGSALYQIQNGKSKLIPYAIKRLLKAARNYSIRELELCGLAIYLVSFSHLLKRVDFDVMVDHLALTHIIQSIAEPATTRIKRLLEHIRSYSFNLYYLKGKDMILSDLLSRQKLDDSNPHGIIPISFNMHNVLHEKYYNIGKSERYLVQIQSQAKSSRVKLQEVHGASKNLNPNIQPENPQEKPRIGQGRVGIRRRPHINQPVAQSVEHSKNIPEVPRIEKEVKICHILQPLCNQ